MSIKLIWFSKVISKIKTANVKLAILTVLSNMKNNVATTYNVVFK